MFQELVSKLALKQKPVTPEILSEKLCGGFDIDCMALFDVLLQASADALKQDNTKEIRENIRVLFCLFASLMAPKSQVAKQAIIKLSVYSKMATEISLAALYDTNPDFDDTGDEIRGKYAMDTSVFTRETGWGVEEFKDEAVQIASLSVRQKTIKDPRNAFEIGRLNTVVKQRQNKSFNKLHRFELNFGDDNSSNNPLYFPDYYVALNAPNCLPDMPIVHYGETVAELEAELSAKIEGMFALLKEYGNST